MRKLDVQRRNTREQKRINRLWANADKQRPRWTYAGNGLEHTIVGGFFDIWRKRPAQKRRDNSLVRF